jgi:ligand-binding sensor domain-containing protein
MMKKINLMARIGLFALILSLGTSAALIIGETKGLALADLSGTPVRLMATAAHGDVIYATLSDGPQAAGIYRSKDNGQTWQRVGSGPGSAVNALAAHPAQDALLYAGTAGGPMATTDSLWRSIDGGRTWHKSALGLPASPNGMVAGVSALAVDPRRPEVLYVGTDRHGVYRFDLTPTRVGYELMGGLSLYRAHVYDLVVGPESRVYALTNEGLFVTEGGTWQQLSVPERAASLAVAPDDPRRLYIGSVSTGIYRSTDAGQSWEQMAWGLDMIPGVAVRVTALAVDENDSRHVMAAVSYGAGNRLAPGGVYESVDGGYSWTRLADADGVVTQLALRREAVVAATEAGLARYGVPIQPSQITALPTVRSGGMLASLPQGQNLLERLSHPSGAQVLILALTIALSGLVLVGRVEWVLNKKSRTVPS